MTIARSMQCPQCGSGYTQSVEMAYSQSVRTGESGYTTISEYGRSLEPPSPRSPFGLPLALAFWVTVVSMISIPVLGNVLPFAWFKGLSWLDKPVVIISIILGVIAGFRSAVSVLVHNNSVHRGEMKKWARGTVCRRCGHRFKH